MGRHEVLMEIVNTERTYIRGLLVMEKAYMNPLKEKSKDLNLTSKDHEAMFADVKSIIATNTALLIDLDAAIKDYLFNRWKMALLDNSPDAAKFKQEWKDHLQLACRDEVDPVNDITWEVIAPVRGAFEKTKEVLIKLAKEVEEREQEVAMAQAGQLPPTPPRKVKTMGEIFVALTPFLRSYTQYVNHFDASIQHFRELKKNNPKFEEFIVARETEAKKHSLLDLRAYMIMPVQRLPRYPLLIAELIKETKADHPDYAELCEALEACKAVAKYVDERMLEINNRKKVVGISRSIRGMEMEIALPHRLFIDAADVRMNVMSNPASRYSGYAALTYVINLETLYYESKPLRVFLFNDLLVYCKRIAPLDAASSSVTSPRTNNSNSNSNNNNSSSTSSNSNNKNNKDSGEEFKYVGVIPLGADVTDEHNVRMPNPVRPHLRLPPLPLPNSSNNNNNNETAAPKSPSGYHHLDLVTRNQIFSLFFDSEEQKQTWEEHLKHIVIPRQAEWSDLLMYSDEVEQENSERRFCSASSTQRDQRQGATAPRPHSADSLDNIDSVKKNVLKELLKFGKKSSSSSSKKIDSLILDRDLNNSSASASASSGTSSSNVLLPPLVSVRKMKIPPKPEHLRANNSNNNSNSNDQQQQQQQQK